MNRVVVNDHDNDSHDKYLYHICIMSLLEGGFGSNKR